MTKCQWHMMTYMPNHRTPILGLTHLRIALQIIHKLLMTLNMYQLKYLKITTLPPPNFQKIVGGTQWNRPLNAKKKIVMKIYQKSKMKNQKSRKKPQKNTPETQTQKTPENSENTPLQEEPINTRGEKYNLRSNPNPNFSDSYRY